VSDSRQIPPEPSERSTPPDALNAETWSRAKDLFAALCEAEPEARERLLASFDPHDPAHAEGERLWRSHAAGVGFMAEPKNRPGSPAWDVLDTSMPATIGAYTPIERLGAGGFGIVYRARQTEPVEREVAVKVLRSGLESPQVLARFSEERRFLARLDHPDVVRILDAGATPDGRLYVVMDLARGQPITEFVQDTAMELEDRLRLFARVCRAVHAVHQRGVIHRDLKPSNLVVSREDDGPRPKIIDFGIAAALHAEDRTGWTLAGAPIGTPRYASPEQVSGGDAVDTRTDVYALGVILGEMLCGQTLRPHASGVETPPTPPSRAAMNAGNAPWARRLRGDLDRIVLKAAAWERSRRYDSAASLADDIDRHLTGLPVRAAPPGRVYIARKFIARHRFAAGAVAFALLALVSGLGAAVHAAGEADRQRRVAESNSRRVAFIGSFLLSTIERNADPDAIAGRVVLDETQLEALASEAIAGLPDDAETMLDLLEKIGLIQYKLGLYQDAAANIRIARDHEARRAGAPSERGVRLTMILAQTLDSNHADNAAAAELRRQALRDAEAIFEPNDPRLLSVRIRSRLPMPELERIVEHLENDPRARADDVITGLSALYWRTEFGPTPSNALPIARRAYERALAHYGPSHSVTINAMSTYASAESVYGSPRDAIPMLHDALERSIVTFGPDHHYTESSRRVLARAYTEAGDPALGMPHAIEHEQRTRRLHGTHSVQHAGSLRILGVLQAQSGDLQAARETLTEATNAAATHWPPNSSTVASIEVHLAEVLAELGAYDEAEVIATRIIQQMNPRQPPLVVAIATSVRARTLAARGDRQAAVSLTREMLAAFEAEGIGGKPYARLQAAHAEAQPEAQPRLP